MKKNNFVSIFSPYSKLLGSVLLNSNISITTFNYFQLLSDGFESNGFELDYFSTHIIKNGKAFQRNKVELLTSFLKKSFRDNSCIIIDSTIFTFLLFGLFAQFFLRKKVVLVITDLPILSFVNFFFVFSHLFLINFFINKVYITKKMKNNFINFNSIVFPILLPMKCEIKEKSFKIEYRNYLFYAGTFDKINNIEKMIMSFLSIDRKDIFLLIAGEVKDFSIQKMFSHYSNIVFLGKIDPIQSRFLMKNAIILLNFRINKLNVTNYSFPFKIMEYINSSRPIFTSYLNSFKYIDNLDDYMTLFYDHEDVNSISSKLLYCIEKKVFLADQADKLYKMIFMKYNVSNLVNHIISL
jgi:glycosyltransferase involved in cell wall biosynthesis